MAVAKTVLDETLGNWKDVRAGVIAEAKNVPAGRWNWRPTPESRTVAELVRHMLEVAMMMSGELVRPDASFRRDPWPKLLATYAKPAYRARTKPALMKLLRSQLKAGVRSFEVAGERALFQDMAFFDGSKGSRFAWLQHGIAHEYYHCGQLALYARMMGITPALTKLIQGG